MSKDDDDNLLTKQLRQDIEKPQKSFRRFVAYFKTVSNSFIAEKNWRIETSREIDHFVRNQNTHLKETLDLKHKRQDNKLFFLRKAHYLDEDIFTYFYPFCLINCTIGTGVVLRKNQYWVICLGIGLMLQYNYFVFSFPLEALVFHRRATSTDKKYA